MAAMLRDSVVIVRTRPRAIPLAMITIRKSIDGFPLLSYVSMGPRLAALRQSAATIKHVYSPSITFYIRIPC